MLTAQGSSVYLALLAFVFTCGIFIRITFAAFFLPIGLEILKWSLRQSRFSLDALVRLLSLPLLVTSTTTLGFVYADSVYFHGFMRPSTVEITPLNFLRYNLLPSNLAEHGLHPRWLHLGVNLPMIATPGLLFYVLWAEFDLFTSRTGEVPKGKPGVVEIMQRSEATINFHAPSPDAHSPIQRITG